MIAVTYFPIFHSLHLFITFSFSLHFFIICLARHRLEIDDQTMIKMYLLLFFLWKSRELEVGLICLMIMLINYESITL